MNVMMAKATWKIGASALALACGVSFVIGEEPVSVRKSGERVVVPIPLAVARPVKDWWLGIRVSKPGPAVLVQLKDIPRGVGLGINGVVAGSPAHAAGLRQYDFVWKMNDQLLVNASQFMTLLNLKNEGDPVTLTIQRRGENHDIELTVEQRPDDQRGQDAADAKVMGPFIPGLLGQIISVVGQHAEISDRNGTVGIRRKGQGYLWAEYDEFDLEMSSGELSGAEDEAFPPGMAATLKKKLQALIRSYEQAERNQQANGRAPRVRRAPTPGAPK